MKSTAVAVGITAFLAVIGKSRPGTFLRTTAYVSAVNIPISAVRAYVDREVNRGVFKLDKIEPQPGKIWERTKHWTCDDMVVGGGLLGIFLALNPRAFPGVGGWKRFLSTATLGCMAGGTLGASVLARGPPQAISLMSDRQKQNRAEACARLRQDEKAQESLSHWGKIALKSKSFPNLDAFARGAPQKDGDLGHFVQSLEAAHKRSQEQMAHVALVRIEFAKGELNGPGFENGSRVYRDDSADHDKTALQDWLERLEEGRKTFATEAQYLWYHLAAKEKEFYSIAAEDPEKDIVRRELQLLNVVAGDFASRDAIFAYLIADATKRLQQTNATAQDLLSTARSTQAELPADWRENHNPQFSADHIRDQWARQKEMVGFLEQASALHLKGQFTPGSPQEAQMAQMEKGAREMRQNLEATERLLGEFEERVRRADERGGKRME